MTTSRAESAWSGEAGGVGSMSALLQKSCPRRLEALLLAQNVQVLAVIDSLRAASCFLPIDCTVFGSVR